MAKIPRIVVAMLMAIVGTSLNVELCNISPWLTL